MVKSKCAPSSSSSSSLVPSPSSDPKLWYYLENLMAPARLDGWYPVERVRAARLAEIKFVREGRMEGNDLAWIYGRKITSVLEINLDWD